MKQETMKAFVLKGPHDFGLQDMPVPEIIKQDDAIVKVTLSTICTSDVHMREGGVAPVNARIEQFGPVIMGHEFCGEIVEVGSAVKGLKPGDQCCVFPIAMCGECTTCKTSLPHFCENGGMFGGVIDGCQAEYVRVPLANKTLIKIPDGLTYEDVLLLPDILGTARFGVENAGNIVGKTVAVIGVGPIGQGVCTLAKKMFGAKTVIALDTLQSRLDAVVKAGVADYALNVLTDDIESIVKEITNGLGVDATIEAAGNQNSFNLACALTGTAGILSVLAIFEAPIMVPMQEIIYKNLTIKMGMPRYSVEEAQQIMEEMMQMIADGKIDTKYMLTHRSPLNDIEKAYKIFGNHEDGCIKWVFTPYQR